MAWASSGTGQNIACNYLCLLDLHDTLLVSFDGQFLLHVFQVGTYSAPKIVNNATICNDLESCVHFDRDMFRIGTREDADQGGTRNRRKQVPVN
jgi:hypothetical protein